MSKIEDRVCEKIQGRAKLGLSKYGISLEKREDLDFIEWMIHLQEELMDATVYIEKVIDSDILNALENMVAIARMDEWHKSTTGRQLMLKDAEEVLKKLGK